MPDLIIIAGANGVGKTTFARPYVAELGYDFLNADDIAKKLSDEGEPSPMVAAGRIFFERLNQFLDIRQSIVVETTLSGSYINKVARRAKANDYKITVIYVFVGEVKTCIERVRMRRQKGGHDVPDEDVERRFYRSFGNFWNTFKELADEWVLTYNGEFGFQQVAVGEGDKLSVENEVLFTLFNSILQNYESGKKN